MYLREPQAGRQHSRPASGRPQHKHPANVARHDNRTFSARLADGVAASVGSWSFIIAQSLIVAGWIALNIIGFARHWDPYPFILLNLCFSTQAAYAAPILQLSQNRQSEHDRQRAEHDYEVNEQALAEIRQLQESSKALAASLGDLKGYRLLLNQGERDPDEGKLT